jgi:hypothetical protein
LKTPAMSSLNPRYSSLHGTSISSRHGQSKTMSPITKIKNSTCQWEASLTMPLSLLCKTKSKNVSKSYVLIFKKRNK